MSLFVKGMQKTGGRRTGARHKISTALLEAFAADFEANGAETVRITRIEKPVEYLRIAVSLLPQQFEIADSRLQEVDDNELNALIEHVRRQAGSAFGNSDGREEPAIN
jgi:hypothetical protein